MIEIRLLSPIEKENNIIRLRELLSRADDLTLNFQDIEDNLNHYDIWVCLVDNKIVYALTAEVVNSVYFIGKGAGDGKLFPWPAFFEAMKPYAVSKECIELSFSGNATWESKLESLGFSVKEYLYTVEIK